MAMHSAWRKLHDLANDACPKCQGSCYVPAPRSRERIVYTCPECEGTGNDAAKKAA